MASETKDSDAIDKPVPRRPPAHIILRTLLSLSISTPARSIDVRFCISSPLDEKMVTQQTARIDRPLSAPRSSHTFRVEIPLPMQGYYFSQVSPSSLGSTVDLETLSDHVKHLYNLVGGISAKQERMESMLEDLQKEVANVKNDVADVKNDMMRMRKDIAALLRYMEEKHACNSARTGRLSVSTTDLHQGSGRRRGRLLNDEIAIIRRTLCRTRPVFGKIKCRSTQSERRAHCGQGVTRAPVRVADAPQA
ncbi:hypothetical protein C8Q78DRAFT_18611 [Trametes maxima]|nr:hypothetical protein C8Q78DRAFT_18611 [Trametes maxima]